MKFQGMPVVLLAAFILIAASIVLSRIQDTSRVRRISVSIYCPLILMFALAQFFLLPDDYGRNHLGTSSFHVLPHSLPLLVLMIGLICIGLEPSKSGTKTFTSMVATTGLSLLSLLFDHPIVLAATWSLVALPLWLDLRSRCATRIAARVFGIYQAIAAVSALFAGLFTIQGLQSAAIVSLLIAVLLRSAMIPGHSWFVAAFERAPLGPTINFYAPQLGAFIYLKYVLNGSIPDQGMWMTGLGMSTALYTGVLALRQRDVRRALAYVLLSEFGLVSFGAGLHGPTAELGAFDSWIAVSIAATGFAMALGALEARRGRLNLDHPVGSFERVPRLATAFLILGLTSVGLPGTFGFIAEDLLFGGGLIEHPFETSLMMMCTAINGITVIRCFFYLFKGNVSRHFELDVLPREFRIFSVAIALLILTGIWPVSELLLPH